MDLQKISLAPLSGRPLAIIGYGNQGRAHALNLRDSGIVPLIGARPGKGWQQAEADGFTPLGIGEAVEQADIVVFLLPDQVIPGVYGQYEALLAGKTIGFAHGFSLHFGWISVLPSCSYFLAAPKGAGAILRREFERGGGLPGVFAVGPNARPDTRDICLAYAKGIGVADRCLIETSFQEETECDLFGEQAVLCGGILELMEAAFETLRKGGLSAEMAFFECCYEARMILELWMQFGPRELADRISPTAFFGGTTRGRRLVTEAARAEMDRIFSEIRSGEFARQWKREIEEGAPTLAEQRRHLDQSALEQVYRKLADRIR